MQAPGGIDFPQPVGLVLPELAQQQRDHRLLLGHRRLGEARLDEGGADLDRGDKVGDGEQDGPAHRMPFPRQHLAGDHPSAEHRDVDQHAERRGRIDEGRGAHQCHDDQQHGCSFGAIRKPREHQQRCRPAGGARQRVDVLCALEARMAEPRAGLDQLHVGLAGAQEDGREHPRPRQHHHEADQRREDAGGEGGDHRVGDHPVAACRGKSSHIIGPQAR